MLELLLNVNEEMRLCKIRFWRALDSNPICDPDHITLAAAQQLTGEKKLKVWWQKPGFDDWFCAGDEFDVKVSAAKHSALDTLIEVMSNPDSPASARVTAAKQVMDYAKAMEKEDPTIEKLLDKINGIDKIEDLQKYLKQGV